MDAALLPNVRVRPSRINWGRRGICIHGTEQVYAARGHISRAQRAFLAELPLTPQAVLQGVRNMCAGIVDTLLVNGSRAAVRLAQHSKRVAGDHRYSSSRSYLSID